MGKSALGSIFVLCGLAMLIVPYTGLLPMTIISASNVYILQQGSSGADGEWHGSYWIVTFLADASESYLYYKFDSSQSVLYGQDAISGQKIVPQAVVEMTITPQQPYYLRALSTTTVQSTPVVNNLLGRYDTFDENLQLSYWEFFWQHYGEPQSTRIVNQRMEFPGGDRVLDGVFCAAKSIRDTYIQLDTNGGGDSFWFDLNVDGRYTVQTYSFGYGVTGGSSINKYDWPTNTKTGVWSGSLPRSGGSVRAWKISWDTYGLNKLHWYYSLTNAALDGGYTWVEFATHDYTLISETVIPSFWFGPFSPSHGLDWVDNFHWESNNPAGTAPALNVPTRTFSTSYWELHTPFQLELKKTVGKNLFDITQTFDTVGGINPVQMTNPNDPAETFYVTELGKLTTGYDISLPDLYFVDNVAYVNEYAIDNVVKFDVASNSFSKYWYGPHRDATSAITPNGLSSPYPIGWSADTTNEIYTANAPTITNLQSYLDNQGYHRRSPDVWGQGYAIGSGTLRINLPYGAANSLVTTKISTELADSVIYSPAVVTGYFTNLVWSRTGNDQITIEDGATENFASTIYNNCTIQGTYIVQASASASELYINPAQNSLTLAPATSNSLSFAATNNGVPSAKACSVTLQLKNQAGTILDTKILNAILNPGIIPPKYSDVTISTSGQGTTNPIAGHYPSTYVQGTDLTIQATASTGHHYVKVMRGSTIITSLPPIIITNLQAIEIIGVFFEPNSVSQATVIIGTTQGGDITPIAGTYQFPIGTQFNMTATPHAGYEFGAWVVNNIQHSTLLSDSVTLSTSGTYVIQALFVQKPPVTDYTYLQFLGVGFVVVGFGLVLVDRRPPISRKKY